jgi:CBS domain containing-hemolysin-like protein
LALPMRAFMVVTRPLLIALNGLANRCLRAVGVEPVNTVAAGHSAQTLRELVDHSAEVGVLDAGRRDQLLTALELDRTALRGLVRPQSQIAGVAVDDGLDRIRDVAGESGHLRLVVRRDGEAVGMVHVRDALDAPPGTRAGDLLRPVLTLGGDEPVYRALTTMRQQRSQFALVTDTDGTLLGLVTMQDLLDRLLPTRTSPGVSGTSGSSGR